MVAANRSNHEKRSSQRVIFPFPVYLSNGGIGETVNISETGLCVGLERDVSNSKVLSLEIEFPFAEKRIRAFGEKIWESVSKKGDRHLLGLRIINPKPDYIAKIQEAGKNKFIINNKIVSLTNEIRTYLLTIKMKCDEFDLSAPSEKQQEVYIVNIQKRIYAALTKYIKNLYKIFPTFNKEEYQIHRKYCQVMLRNVFIDNVEVNRHVLRKPLDYAGDFMLINYYYDFHDKHLGSTTFEKLINHYSLNLFISKSVVRRKEFFKKKIQEVILAKDQAKILSVGSGSARELTELLNEGRINKDFWFDCLDFERESIKGVQKDLAAVEENKKRHLKIMYINKSLIEVVKENNFDFGKKYDFIYSSGLFDYLKDRIASKMIHNLYSLLKEGGELIVTNAGAEVTSEQMYYGMLGEWDLIYRKPADLLKWAKNFDGAKEISIIDTGTRNSFLFFRIRK